MTVITKSATASRPCTLASSPAGPVTARGGRNGGRPNESFEEMFRRLTRSSVRVNVQGKQI
jgi:hypothetical protein